MARTKTVTGRGLLFLLAVALTLPISMLAQKSETRPVRVYIFTAAPEGGFVDADSKGRADSVKDVQGYLRGKKKTVALVENLESAEITLEVLGRGREATGNTTLGTDPVFGGTKSYADKAGMLRVKLTVGDYSTEIVGNGGHQGRVWSIAAHDVAGDVDKWIKDNAARIPRK